MTRSATNDHRPLSQIQSDLEKAKRDRRVLDERIETLRDELTALVAAATQYANLES